jgi:hypothetical protein
MMDEFDYLLSLIDNETKEETINKKCCNNEYISVINGYNTCINCGCVSDVVLITDNSDNNMSYIQRVPYKRITYFKHKINLLTGHYDYIPNAKLLFLISNIKASRKRLSLSRIRFLLKKNNLSKYYKYIYSIYKDIYDEPLINISNSVMSDMIYRFIDIERYFKKNIKRKNMLSYNTTIWLILKHNNIKNSDKMLLPYNATKIKKILKKIIDSLNC